MHIEEAEVRQWRTDRAVGDMGGACYACYDHLRKGHKKRHGPQKRQIS